MLRQIPVLVSSAFFTFCFFFLRLGFKYEACLACLRGHWHRPRLRNGLQVRKRCYLRHEANGMRFFTQRWAVSVFCCENVSGDLGGRALLLRVVVTRIPDVIRLCSVPGNSSLTAASLTEWVRLSVSAI